MRGGDSAVDCFQSTVVSDCLTLTVTIQALSLLTVRSKLFKECMTLLAIASSYFHIELVWVPGHSGIVGNC